jgi:hypothetical protein
MFPSSPPPACPSHEVTPSGAPPARHDAPLLSSSPWPPCFSSPSTLSLSHEKPPSSLSSTCSATVPCFPQPLRCDEKVRDVSPFIPAKRIEPWWPESPPPSRIPCQKRSSSLAKFFAANHPLAKPTPPAGPQ